jgi:acyl dehydratase
MVQNWKQVGPQRYRETFGRYFEDFEIGDVYEHRPGKTVTEADNHLFTLLTLNTHPLHFDAEYGKATEFGQNLVVSTYTLALLIGMSVSDCSQKAIANLGMDEVKFPAPVFAGDTLYAESEVLAKRKSKSRPGQGVVEIRTTGKNQRGEIIGVFKRSMLIPARGQSVEDRIGTY